MHVQTRSASTESDVIVSEVNKHPMYKSICIRPNLNVRPPHAALLSTIVEFNHQNNVQQAVHPLYTWSEPSSNYYKSASIIDMSSSTTTYPARTGESRKDFLAVFPLIVDELLTYMKKEGMPQDAVKWYEDVSPG